MRAPSSVRHRAHPAGQTLSTMCADVLFRKYRNVLKHRIRRALPETAQAGALDQVAQLFEQREVVHRRLASQ